jgi:NADP-dependent 3-hydroxy acid dehydrogenase YdfG
MCPGLVGTGLFDHDTANTMLAANPYLASEDIADGIAYVLAVPPNVQVR